MPLIDIFASIALAVPIATLVILEMMPGRIARKCGHRRAQAVTVGWATLICGFAFRTRVVIWTYVHVQGGQGESR